MPTYHAHCDTCGRDEDVILPISRYKDLPECCGERMRHVLYPCYSIPDIEPYRSMVTGEYITGRAKHRDHLRQHNCIELGNENVTKRESYVEKAREKRELREYIGAKLLET